MKANELRLVEFLQSQNVQFIIPVYQRNYDWSIDQCSELLKDTIATVKENRASHFIGSIVFIYEGAYSTNEVKELVIIDGQQRLTTLNILYVALYQYAKESGLAQEADRIYNMFLTNQYVSKESNKLKLKQTDTNSKAFNAIMSGTGNEFDEYSNVIENYNFFKGKINEDSFKLIQDGLNRLLFVEISLERDKDDPQRIFESLNSTGLDLSQSDLIRNFILMDLEPKEQERIYREIWNPIENNARDLSTKKSMVSSYIRDYLTLKNKKIARKNSVYQEFKSKYASRKGEEYESELEAIKSLSAHYKKLINPSQVKDADLRKELTQIARLEINVAYPFLLQILEDAENGLIDNTIVLSVLRLIQSYTWRRFIVGLPTNALNKIFMSLYSEVDHENYLESIEIALLRKKSSGKFPSDEEILVALRDKNIYSAQPKNRNYFFEQLENFNNREFVDTANENITIEHIFPQNPDIKWNDNLNQQDFIAFKDKYLDTIGNLTLSGNNGALSNKTFAEKKNMNVNDLEQGYVHSRLWLNSYLKTIDSWSLESFEERLSIIYNRFLEIWKYPSVNIPVDAKYSEQNIFDAEDPTFRKLDYFIFENDKIEESAIAQMYFLVSRRIFEKSPQFFLNNDQEVLNISKDKEDFRAAQELVNGYYIEANIDNKSKFSILKKLLLEFKLELIIKYSDENDSKNRGDNDTLRLMYWKQLLPELNNYTEQYLNVSAKKHYWLAAGSGMGGVSFNIEVTKNETRISLSINTSEKSRNQSVFRHLFKYKTEIEEAVGKSIEWDEMVNHKMSYIKLADTETTVYNEDDWISMNRFFCKYAPPFFDVFKTYINKIKKS